MFCVIVRKKRRFCRLLAIDASARQRDHLVQTASTDGATVVAGGERSKIVSVPQVSISEKRRATQLPEKAKLDQILIFSVSPPAQITSMPFVPRMPSSGKNSSNIPMVGSTMPGTQLAWALLVDSALLNNRLADDIKDVATTKNVPLPIDV